MRKGYTEVLIAVNDAKANIKVTLLGGNKKDAESGHERGGGEEGTVPAPEPGDRSLPYHRLLGPARDLLSHGVLGGLRWTVS